MKLKEIAVAGLALTILGTFCPLISMPIMGSSNFYTGGGIKSIDGLIFIVLCAWIGYDIYKENFLSLRWKSILLFVDILISTFLNYIRIDNIKAKYFYGLSLFCANKMYFITNRLLLIIKIRISYISFK